MNPTLSTVIGWNVHRIRTKHGFTLDDVARHARAWGTTWNTGRVSRIERGQGEVTVETMLLLSLVLTDLTGEAVAPSELLSTQAPEVELSSREVLPGGIPSAVFSGNLRRRQPMTVPIVLTRDEDGEGFQVAGYLPTEEAINAATAVMTLADERAARKLGLSVEDFTRKCVELWGHLMSAEVEKRAEPGDTPQKKGRITRVLLDELREAVRRGND